MKQRLHIKWSIVMNKKRCISVLRGRSDRDVYKRQDPFRAGVNTKSNPPGEYGRQVETQRN